MERPKVTVIASSVRPWLWDECLESLRKNERTKYEVLFAGNLDKFQVRPFIKRFPELGYIHSPVKPAQCYQLSFLHADFESLILYIADDAEFDPGLLDKSVDLYLEQDNPKAIISLRTNENGRAYGTEVHTLLGWNVNTPLMAPIGLVSQRFIAELGGFDRRFICGQWENDFVMRAYANGGTVIPFDEGPWVHIAHEIKHKTYFDSPNPFWSSYDKDRIVLENTWVKGGYRPSTPIVKVTFPDTREVTNFKILDNRKVLKTPQLPFEPYDDVDLLKKNQGPTGIWEGSDK